MGVNNHGVGLGGQPNTLTPQKLRCDAPEGSTDPVSTPEARVEKVERQVDWGSVRHTTGPLTGAKIGPGQKTPWQVNTVGSRLGAQHRPQGEGWLRTRGRQGKGSTPVAEVGVSSQRAVHTWKRQGPRLKVVCQQGWGGTPKHTNPYTSTFCWCPLYLAVAKPYPAGSPTPTTARRPWPSSPLSTPPPPSF